MMTLVQNRTGFTIMSCKCCPFFSCRTTEFGFCTCMDVFRIAWKCCPFFKFKNLNSIIFHYYIPSYIQDWLQELSILFIHTCFLLAKFILLRLSLSLHSKCIVTIYSIFYFNTSWHIILLHILIVDIEVINFLSGVLRGETQPKTVHQMSLASPRISMWVPTQFRITIPVIASLSLSLIILLLCLFMLLYYQDSLLSRSKGEQIRKPKNPTKLTKKKDGF